MAAFTVSSVDFYRDRLLGTVSTLGGRLFPTLEPPPVDFTTKVAIITGGNSGIGLQIALDIIRQGATVYLACRSISKAEEAVSQIVSKVPASKGRVKSLSLDTSSLTSVRAFAEEWESLNIKIDLLFHNAGIGSAPAGPRFSADGFPVFYATNFLGSFLLTYLLEPHLSGDARIILTSSFGHYRSVFASNFSLSSIKERDEPGFHVPKGIDEAGKVASDSALYGQTKAMQLAFAKLLQKRFDRKTAEAGMQSRRIVHAFHPGFVLTPVFEKLPKKSFLEGPLHWMLRMSGFTALAVDVTQGAATGVWLAGTNDNTVVGEGMGGGYWDRMTRRVSNVDMMDKEIVERFWVRWEADAGVEWR